LKGAQGVVDVPGFYDGIEPPTAAELEAWLSLPFVEEEFRAKEARVLALTGEPGFTVLERSWARPTLEVHGIRGGFTGDGAKTVIPCEAVTKLSCRLVPGQNPEHVAQCLAAAIAAATPPGATAEFRVLHAASACVVDPANRYVHEAAEAMSEVFGNRTVYTRSGGSIPVVGLFQEVFAMPSVMMGFGLPDDNLHAPNEKVYLPNVSRGITAMARYWERLGGHA
jgi:acetylornithine deacetylase/succinyl-diaminopimelate desuccinylase-like protein